MANTYNNLEDYVMNLLSRINIYYPYQLTIETIYPRLGLSVYYLPQDSMAIADNLFLDNRMSDAALWQEFGHELCHILWHAGDQALIPLSMREYQEWKAENFAQHLCIPTFMLNEKHYLTMKIKLPG
ncbi:ImmA/IrrE family metallo-endopeptidase [Planococcus kocurii]|uniref:ImmA/IrrE family metallo-endopeptidase n=1 Tax=Planococcus kocurii TaxID=1374 RepID=UPI003D04EC09